MQSVLHSRVESKRAEKYKKIFLVCGLGMILIALVKIFTKYTGQPDGNYNVGFGFDTLFLLFFGLLSVFQYQNDLRKRQGQFIEWWSDKIVFKSKDNREIQEVFTKQITAIKIELDNIEIATKESLYNLNIMDYTDFNTRLLIKSNFENIGTIKH